MDIQNLQYHRGILYATKILIDKIASNANLIEIEKINEEMFSNALDLIVG